MASPEKKVKQKIRQILDSFDAYHFMPATHGYGASGTADIVVCFRGRFVAIEVKATDKNKPTALQCLAARQVIAAGGTALLVHAENTHVVAEAFKQIESGAYAHSVWPDLFSEVV